MNWDLKTAAGREKLMILRRKLNMLYSMQPDLFAGKPYSFFHYMAEDCVLRSEKLPEPLTGQAIRDFLIREKQISTGLGPTMMTNMVESTADGRIAVTFIGENLIKSGDGTIICYVNGWPIKSRSRNRILSFVRVLILFVLSQR